LRETFGDGGQRAHMLGAQAATWWCRPVPAGGRQRRRLL